MFSQVKRWFSNGNKIAKLQSQQNDLEKRRDRLYEDIASLEEVEKSFLQQGRSAESMAKKRRLASQLFHLRQDIKRLNAIVNLVGKRISILSTDIHNMSIIDEGRSLGLDMPTIEVLTENAVAAEECIEQLNESANIASQLTIEQDKLQNSDDLTGIIAEFDVEKKSEEIKAVDQPVDFSGWDKKLDVSTLQNKQKIVIDPKYIFAPDGVPRYIIEEELEERKKLQLQEKEIENAI